MCVVLSSCHDISCYVILIDDLQVWNPPDTESTYGISYDNCEAKAMPGSLYLVKW
jgi:hypothetical protein